MQILTLRCFIIGAIYCRNSCFGASNLTSGFSNYRCADSETLIGCQTTTIDRQLPNSNAGVICSKCNSVLHTTLVMLISPPPIANGVAPQLPLPDYSICSTQMTTPSLTSPTSPRTVTTSPSLPSASNESMNIARMESQSCATIGAALGIALVLLLFTLVGIIMGWVWSCHRKKLVSNPQT